MAKALNINCEGVDNLKLANMVAKVALKDLLGPEEGPMSFALALVPKNIDRLVSAGIVPQKGAAETLVQGLHSTAQGMMSKPDSLINSCLKFGVIDILALYISTQLQDIMFGVPTPKDTSKNNFPIFRLYLG